MKTVNLHPIIMLTIVSFFSSIGCVRKSNLASKLPTPPAKPRLIVLIVVDQMRADLLDRFEPAFRKMTKNGKPEGLDKLRTEGFSFINARTASAPTVTAAGHATLCTGANASKHGIVANSFFSRDSREIMESAADPKTKIVRTSGVLPNDPLSKLDSNGSSNHHLLSPSLADSLHTWSAKTAKILSISIKDRGAVFCGGTNSTGVYWYDYQSGSMITSSHFRDSLPDWLNDFNKNNAPSFNYTWTPKISANQMKDLLTDENYKRALSVRSQLSNKFGSGFPYSYSAAAIGALGARKFFEYTPYASEHLVDLALAGVEKERLGCASKEASTECLAPQFPDLLTISFSTPDIVGHGFGPESAELMDIYLSLNKSVERLREGLQNRLGDSAVLFAQSADHGVQNMPEVSAAFGKNAGRLNGAALKNKLNSALISRFGGSEWIDHISTNEIYLNQATLSASQKTLEEIWAEVRKSLSGLPGIKGLLTRAEIQAAKTEEAQLFKRGHHPARSGDAVILVQQGWLGEDSVAGNHGTSNDEDSRIPLVFSGWKVKRGISNSMPVQADDLAPTILELIGAPKSAHMTGVSRANLKMLD